jgi:hypothetical protein
MNDAVSEHNCPGDGREFSDKYGICDLYLLTGADDMDMPCPIHGLVSGKAG